MPTAQQDGGGLSEASRLLQEGLQLLDDRTREVDAAIHRGEDRARQITEEARERALDITAEAERQRAELEEQVEALRAEIATARQELADLKAAKTEIETPPPAVIPPVGAAAQAATASAAVEAVASTEASQASTGQTGSEPADTPRWGRPSSPAAAQQALRERSSRPRWLPPWLPFVILLLAAAGLVAANVGSFGGARSLVGDASSPSPTRDAAVVTRAPTPADSPAAESGLALAAATSIATSLAVAAGSLPQSTSSQTPTRAPALTVNGVQAASAASTPSTPMPQPTATPAPTRQASAPPPPRPAVTSVVPPPDALSPDGPIVAAYTAYASYTVKAGDTLNRVATQFGVSGESIMRASGLTDPNLLQPGQVLRIPRDSGWLYRVQSNETIDEIAARFGVSVDDLLTASKLSSPTIHVGDLLFIPNPPAPTPK